MSQLHQIKEQNHLDGILITDSKGFQIHNNGFTHSNHLHSLKQLSNFFFPNMENTIVGIQTTDYTIIVRDLDDKIVATRQIKESQ